MMKRGVFFAAILATGLTAHATDYGTFTFLQSDNTATSLTANGLKMVFADGNLVVTQGSQTVTFSLATLSSMYFSNAGSTSIAALRTGETAIRTAGGTVRVCSPVTAQVALFRLDGMKVAEKTVPANSEETLGSSLSEGLYIVSVNGVKTKIFVR